ncbi:MAG: hypothetical protein AABZ30_13630 [Myxococcota bacterium]
MKPQDLLVALHFASRQEPRGPVTYADLGRALGISHGEAHNAHRRAALAGLVRSPTSSDVHRAALYEFLVHGVRYVFPPVRGAPGRGLPTAHSAPALAQELAGDNLPIVWPWARGEVYGETLKPIYRSVPEAASKDARLYQALALVDALRVGRARERSLACDHLRKLLRLPEPKHSPEGATDEP